MGIGLGDILGSISPAYGLISGQGLGGLARNLNPIYLLLHNFGNHSGPSATPASVSTASIGASAIPGISGQQPLASLPGPTLGQTAAAMPQMASSPNPLAMIGSSLASSNKGDPGIQPFTSQAPALVPPNSGLGSILAQILGSM